MTRVTVDALTCAKLINIQNPLELCDDSGHLLGRFIPILDPSLQGMLDPGVSEEELDRREREEGGRSLAEILAELERRA
ncbi:MAG TPA: hypothetical protein VGH74_02085 [Planctomycetaceae bacterium]